ncbi:MAG: growth inhibitor [Planctomycetes bacterium GWA2_39_15]|nr:MAG: growth inhibitor [Planctomycetes bacterium GWA2_39_15]OHB41480.1 MAG: growth inhibitor [Planctomycetes bacterium GWC2_39_26]
MQFMTVCNRGDVVLVPFPFSNQTTVKKRPSVIVSSDVYNNTSSDIVIMTITGKTDKTLNVGECLIEDWRGAGLLKPSSIKPAISTIEQRLVLRKLGKLSTKDLISMEEALKEFLELKERSVKK